MGKLKDMTLKKAFYLIVSVTVVIVLFLSAASVRACSRLHDQITLSHAFMMDAAVVDYGGSGYYIMDAETNGTGDGLMEFTGRELWICRITEILIVLPWLGNLMGLSPEVTGAWLGGTIDTTGAVAAAGTLADKGNGDVAAQTAVIVKSSQNVLLGAAAFIISLMWSYQGKNQQEKPTLGVIWDRFPKFVVGFILASLVFSFCFDTETAKAVGKVTKGFQNTLFSIAFVCIGLETRFKEIFSKENRKPLTVFLTAQAFNIIVTLIISYVIFGIKKD